MDNNFFAITRKRIQRSDQELEEVLGVDITTGFASILKVLRPRKFLEVLVLSMTLVLLLFHRPVDVGDYVTDVAIETDITKTNLVY